MSYIIYSRMIKKIIRISEIFFTLFQQINSGHYPYGIYEY